MKKIFIFLGIISCSVFVFGQTNVLTENFGYPDGTVLSTSNSTTNWFQHSGTQGQITVNSGMASTVSGQTEDINKAFSTAYAISTTGAYKVELSATITILNSTGLNTTGDYFLSLAGTVTTSNVTTGISSLPARLYVKSGTTGALLGILNNSGGTVAPTFATTEIAYNTPTTVLLRYEVTRDASNVVTLQQATLIVGSETLINSTGTTAAPASVSGIAIRQGTSTGNIVMDNISVVTYTPVLGVSDLINVNKNFVKNTLVNDQINFGTKANVKVYNLNGQIVKSANVSQNNSLDVQDLTPGMYIVTGIVNGEPVSQKILKK